MKVHLDEIYASLHTERILLFCAGILAFSFSESSQTQNQPRETTREASDLLSAGFRSESRIFVMAVS